MRKISLLIAALSTSLLFSCNSGQQDTTDTADSINSANSPTEESPASPMAAAQGDSEFAVEAASGGLAEVELGKLAQTKGSNAEVKGFGEMMVKDHSKANEELKTIAEAKGITLPPAPGEAQQKVIADLTGKTGSDFDKNYIDAMVKDHKKDISLFEDASKSLKDPQLKAFVDKTLPTLKMHLSHCEAVQQKLK
jgi:putative membrane protein